MAASIEVIIIIIIIAHIFTGDEGREIVVNVAIITVDYHCHLW